ncbi:MAG TPA: hypothetical protein VE153_26995 [Myxococcus sp.]|nr:hypothetical protein [Myxococcus sp.]
MRQGIRANLTPLKRSISRPLPDGLELVLGALLLVLAGPARAEGRDVTATLEVNAGRDFRALSLLGDVELRDDATFLALGYTAARTGEDTAPTHQLLLGVDHAAGDHWLLSAMANVGLPKSTLVPLAPERPLLRLPAVDARTGYSSQGLLLSAAFDSGGFSDSEYGFDAGLSLTRYALHRELRVTSRTDTTVRYARDERLWVARPSAGARLLLGLQWELGLRAGFSLYSGDPLTAGQFTDAEVSELAQRFENAVEARLALRGLRTRIQRDLGSALTRRMSDVNATSGITTAPVRFDLKPSLTWRLSSRLRGQLSYAFTRYVSGQGFSQVLATRWTLRLGEARVWGAVALQQDHLGDAAQVPEDGGQPSPVRSGLVTLGGEYTF